MTNSPLLDGKFYVLGELYQVRRSIFSVSVLAPVRTTAAFRPSTLTCHENRAFRKRSSNRGNLSFSVNENHCENRAFRKLWHHDNRVISLTKFPATDTNPKMAVNRVFKFLWSSADRKLVMPFQSENAVFKFSLPNLNGALVTQQ